MVCNFTAIVGNFITSVDNLLTKNATLVRREENSIIRPCLLLLYLRGLEGIISNPILTSSFSSPCLAGISPQIPTVLTHHHRQSPHIEPQLSEHLTIIVAIDKLPTVLFSCVLLCYELEDSCVTASTAGQTAYFAGRRSTRDRLAAPPSPILDSVRRRPNISSKPPTPLLFSIDGESHKHTPKFHCSPRAHSIRDNVFSAAAPWWSQTMLVHLYTTSF
jgi:hypothetical protein